jgi:hypothetical protein
MYFNAAPVEDLLRLSNINATIQAPANDSLFVVDANIAGNTANQYIDSTLNDQVAIDDRGDVTHHTILRYVWGKNGHVFGSPLYSDYVRIYVPPDSLLQQQQGWAAGGTSEAFGRAVWAGSFTLSYGQANTLTLTWIEKGGAQKNASGWHYQFLVQRQAGVMRMMNLQIKLPACTSKTSTSGGLLSHTNQEVMLNTALTKDTAVGVDYRC